MRSVLAVRLFVASVACSACSASPEAATEAPVTEDAGQARSLGTRDGGATSGIALADGGSLQGHVIARYDHSSWWWDTSKDVTFAVFDDRSYRSEWDRDRSLRFLETSEFAQAPPGPSLNDAYREFIRMEAGYSPLVMGRSPLDGVARVLAGNDGYHLHEGGFGDFAWDLVKTDISGEAYSGSGDKLTDYYVWDQPVYLPSGGWVVDVEDELEDNPPGEIPGGPMKEIGNNMVGVQLHGAYYLYVFHFKKGSVPRAKNKNCEPHILGVPCVETGVRLPTGSYLGRAGNSGVTYEPHVHIALYYYDTWREPERSWSVPTEFKDVFVSTRWKGGVLSPFAVPKTGTYISSTPF